MARTATQQRATARLVARNKARKRKQDRVDKNNLPLLKTNAEIERYLKRHYPYGAPQRVVMQLEAQQKCLKRRYR